MPLNQSPPAISKENYVFLQQYVYRTSGIVLDDNKHYLLEARLLPIARREDLGCLNELCAVLRSSGSERVMQDVRDAMTTNETLFFRDALPFKAMRETLLPELLAKRSGSLTFWSAAASTGQEAYSLAMMLLEMGIQPAAIDILATDISEKVLEQARSGRYTQAEVGRGLPAQQLVKYFKSEAGAWRIKDEVRRLVRFEVFDLRERMSLMGPFDFVLCRNVLIYFDIETKRRILAEMERTLRGDGFLLLGAAETMLNVTELFGRRSAAGVSFYQRRGFMAGSSDT